MSAGAFVYSKYEADNSIIWRIRVQPETLQFTDGTVSNAAPVGAIDQGFPELKLNGTAKKFSLVVRKIAVRVTGASVDPERGDYLQLGQLYKLVILTPATFDALNVNGTGTYLGFPVDIFRKYQESGAVDPV